MESNDVVVVGLLHEALAGQLLLDLGVEAGDVHAARHHGLGVLVDGDDLRALLERRDGGAAAREARAYDEHVALLRALDLVLGDGLGRYLPAVLAGHVGAGRGAALRHRDAALAARGGVGLGVGLRLGRAAGHAGHGRTGERRAAQAQERATRQALLPHALLFLHENPSLIRLANPARPFCAPERSVAAARRLTLKPTLPVINPQAGGNASPRAFPPAGGMPASRVRHAIEAL